MSDVKRNYTEATTNPYKALAGLISCINSGRNCWIEYMDNEDESITFAVMQKNPALNNPFNWQMNYGTPKSEQRLYETTFFNDTEKEMTYNWTALYGTKEAIEMYQKEGKITKDLNCRGGGICHPVKIEDANKHRKQFVGDNYKYGESWTTFWKPKDGIPYYVREKGIKVFVICYNDEPADEEEILRSASNFLTKITEEKRKLKGEMLHD